jgi:hypothetical protein
VGQQAPLDALAAGIWRAVFAVPHEEISDHAFVVFVNEERIAKDFAA